MKAKVCFFQGLPAFCMLFTGLFVNESSFLFFIYSQANLLLFLALNQKNYLWTFPTCKIVSAHFGG